MTVELAPDVLRRMAASAKNEEDRAALLEAARRADRKRRGGPQGTRRSRCDLADHVHDSVTEARVCGTLRSELAGVQVLLFVATRLPAWALGPQPNGKPLYVSIDFAVVDPVTFRVLRLVDAKPKHQEAVSRDWKRGRAALERTYGVRVEERSR